MRSAGITNVAPYAAAPAVGAAGDTYFNTTAKRLYVSDGTSWIPVPGTQPLGITAHGTAGQPAVNAVMNLSVVDGGQAAMLASNTITLPVGGAGLYLIAFSLTWRSNTIVGIRAEVTNSAGTAYSPSMMVSISQALSTWDPCTAGATFLRQCVDGDTFRVTNRGNAQTTPDYVQVGRLSVVRIGDSFAP